MKAWFMAHGPAIALATLGVTVAAAVTAKRGGLARFCGNAAAIGLGVFGASKLK